LIAGTLLLAACADNKPRFTDGGMPDDEQHDAANVPTDAGVDAIDAAVGRPGAATISGAVTARSPHYKVYGTLRSGDGSSASPSYQRRGGVTGATQP
jgi:hypothetical protein